MPVFTLVLWLLPPILRISKTSVLENLSAQYALAARAKGVSRYGVVTKHVLRNSLITVANLLGIQLGILLSGSVIVEAVFAWPGIGSVMVDAIRTRDYPVVQAGVLLSVAMYSVINLVVDLVVTALDPRLAHT
jgi:peptide/nickel transport system permease protein